MQSRQSKMRPIIDPVASLDGGRLEEKEWSTFMVHTGSGRVISICGWSTSLCPVGL